LENLGEATAVTVLPDLLNGHWNPPGNDIPATLALHADFSFWQGSIVFPMGQSTFILSPATVLYPLSDVLEDAGYLPKLLENSCRVIWSY
jgi:hypothetical protein